MYFEYTKKLGPKIFYLPSKLIIDEESHPVKAADDRWICKGADNAVTALPFVFASLIKLRLTKAGFVGFGMATELVDSIETTSVIAGRFATSAYTH